MQSKVELNAKRKLRSKVQRRIRTSLILGSLVLFTLCSCRSKEAAENESDERIGLESVMEMTSENGAADGEISNGTQTEMESGEPYTEDMNWFEFCVAQAFNKRPEELTQEAYDKVVEVVIRLENTERSISYSVQIETVDDDGWHDVFVQEVGKNQFSLPETLDFSPAARCRNLATFVIMVKYHSNLNVRIPYGFNWDSLKKLETLSNLHIWFEPDDEETYYYDSGFEHLSVVGSMPNLERISLEGIRLSEDISCVFKNDIEEVALRNCGLTEKSFQNMESYDNLPEYLALDGNAISDASNLLAELKADGSRICSLQLSNNPLTSIGDTSQMLKEKDLTTDEQMSLGLYGTDFEKYGFLYNADN